MTRDQFINGYFIQSRTDMRYAVNMPEVYDSIVATARAEANKVPDGWEWIDEEKFDPATDGLFINGQVWEYNPLFSDYFFSTEGAKNHIQQTVLIDLGAIPIRRVPQEPVVVEQNYKLAGCCDKIDLPSGIDKTRPFTAVFTQEPK